MCSSEVICLYSKFNFCIRVININNSFLAETEKEDIIMKEDRKGVDQTEKSYVTYWIHFSGCRSHTSNFVTLFFFHRFRNSFSVDPQPASCFTIKVERSCKSKMGITWTSPTNQQTPDRVVNRSKFWQHTQLQKWTRKKEKECLCLYLQVTERVDVWTLLCICAFGLIGFDQLPTSPYQIQGSGWLDY